MGGVNKAAREESRAKSLGVTIEARYTVGEYDILILSAAQSNGLEIWLRENGYTIPPGASAVSGLGWPSSNTSSNRTAGR